jgi:hypothetical protein
VLGLNLRFSLTCARRHQRTETGIKIKDRHGGGPCKMKQNLQDALRGQWLLVRFLASDFDAVDHYNPVLSSIV